MERWSTAKGDLVWKKPPGHAYYSNRRRRAQVKKLSTGQDSTLGEYLKLAKIFGPEAVAFIQHKIDESPRGANEEVIVDEAQMVHLLLGYSLQHKG
jgi:hypothetical protein